MCSIVEIISLVLIINATLATLGFWHTTTALALLDFLSYLTSLSRYLEETERTCYRYLNLLIPTVFIVLIRGAGFFSELQI